MRELSNAESSGQRYRRHVRAHAVVDGHDLRATRSEFFVENAGVEQLLQTRDIGVAFFFCVERERKWLWEDALASDEVFLGAGRALSLGRHGLFATHVDGQLAGQRVVTSILRVVRDGFVPL